MRNEGRSGQTDSGVEYQVIIQSIIVEKGMFLWRLGF